MLDYSVELIEDQVVFTLNYYNSPSFEHYTSPDGFLSIMVVAGQSDGWLGYGGMQIYLCTECFPIVLKTPHYEHAQDLTDVIDRIETNMQLLKYGNILS
jgi:hypothetical protein